tara:strand:- start:3229 stop:3414 length:186 start_codon:yes stop_codon:yes gene_type:complete
LHYYNCQIVSQIKLLLSIGVKAIEELNKMPTVVVESAEKHIKSSISRYSFASILLWKVKNA